MEAGRELDALIAEKVMGWTRKGEGWCPPGWESTFMLSAYSTDIAAAWQVVEHFDRSKWCFDLEAFDAAGEDAWGARFVSWEQLHPVFRGYEPREYAATAPLAICKAALNAVRAEAEGDARFGPEVTA